jgi:hypothetical protein
MSELSGSLQRLLTERLPETSRFFERAATDVSAPTSVGFRALFASVPRRLGASAAATLAPAAELSFARSHWTATDFARLYLLSSALPHLPTAEQPAWQPAWLLALFEAGEIGEQVSLLRVLGALPDAARFVEVGLQACRHNSLDVFEAIVCENPFITAHFPDLGLNQAVMKAIFNGVSIKRIESLESRITPELSRMAAGYASERRAAGRVVPADAEFLSNYGA